MVPVGVDNIDAMSSSLMDYACAGRTPVAATSRIWALKIRRWEALMWLQKVSDLEPRIQIHGGLYMSIESLPLAKLNCPWGWFDPRAYPVALACGASSSMSAPASSSSEKYRSMIL